MPETQISSHTKSFLLTLFCLRSQDRLIVNIITLTGCLNKDLQKPFQYWSPKHKLNCSATIITQKYTDESTAQEILG